VLLAVLEVGSGPVAIIAVRLQPSMALGAPHIFTPPFERINNVDGDPSTSAVAHLTLIDQVVHWSRIA
jgi:hypothetical protein